MSFIVKLVIVAAICALIYGLYMFVQKVGLIYLLLGLFVLAVIGFCMGLILAVFRNQGVKS